MIEQLEQWLGVGLFGLIAFSIVVVLVGLLIDFLPTLVSVKRDANRTLPIFAFNLLFGWIPIVWLGLLYWAFTAPKKPTPEDKKWSAGALSSVVFGDQVAFIPAVPGYFDVAFSAHSGIGGALVYDGEWVNQGDALRGFGMSKHDPECSTCRSEIRMALRLIDRKVHGRLEVPIYSPVSGLVIDAQSFRGDDPDFLQSPNGSHKDRYHFMYAMLLPRGTHVPETMGPAAAEFCTLCSEYRKSLFRARDYQKLTNVVGIADEELVSDERIDNALARFRGSQIIVRSASELPEKYKDKIALLRQKHPTSFR